MEIIKTLNKDELTVKVIGELNTTNYEQLEKAISDSIKGLKVLIFDFEKLDYISSAGLRVLLVAKKALGSNGRMIVRNANKSIMDIFEITGFVNVLEFE